MPDPIKFIELQAPKENVGQRRPQHTSSSSGENKVLYLYFSGYGGPHVSYALCIVSGDKSFNLNFSDRTKPIPLEISNISRFSIDNAKGMGCGRLGSKIFFVGGQKLQNDLYGTEGEKNSDASSSTRYSRYDYSSKVFVMEKADSNSDSASESHPLLSGKASPLVLPVGNSLYVLAGAPVYAVPDPPFEKYNYDSETSTGNSSKLPSPPFLDPNCKYFEDPGYCAHALIGYKINVSTSSSSFSFDTTTEKWETCTMFGERATDVEYPSPFEWLNYPNTRSESCPGGAPFDFNGGSVLFNGNILICVVLSEGFVVACRLGEDGKVKERQHVKDLELPSQAISACLAEIDHDFFCLVVSCFDHNQDDNSLTSMTSFHVSPDTNKIVRCDDLKRFDLPSLKQSSSDNPIWSCINCFVG